METKEAFREYLQDAKTYHWFHHNVEGKKIAESFFLKAFARPEFLMPNPLWTKNSEKHYTIKIFCESWGKVHTELNEFISIFNDDETIEGYEIGFIKEIEMDLWHCKNDDYAALLEIFKVLEEEIEKIEE